MSRILGVVQDTGIQQALLDALVEIGSELIFTSPMAPDFADQLKLPISMVLLDVGVDQDLTSLCKLLKPACRHPVLVLIPEGNENSIVEYMQKGASDCIVKPLRVSELRARIQVALITDSHENLTSTSDLYCRGLRVDLTRRRVFREGEEIAVTRTGYRLLVYFLQHKSRVITKEELLREVWGYSSGSEDRNLVETAIRRLRMEIEADPRRPVCLHTVWGVGYLFEEPA